MRQYYIYDGQTKKGPFDITQLKLQNISKETPVWYEGLQNWSVAKDVNDLNELLSKNGAPPPLPKALEKNVRSKNDILNSFENAQEIFVENKRRRYWIPIVILLLAAGVVAALFLLDK